MAACTSPQATRCWHSQSTGNRTSGKRTQDTSMSRTRIVLWAAGVFFTGAALAAHAADQPQPALENSVVKIFSTMRYPDPFKPWTKQAPSEATASGVVIEGKRILTNAHAVLYASQVQIQAN